MIKIGLYFLIMFVYFFEPFFKFGFFILRQILMFFSDCRLTINSCNIFCLPSHQENFGISVAEALMCSKPVLITNKVNIWREINKANAGFVNNDTIEGVTINLKKWISLNNNQYKKMSKNAYNCFNHNFNLEKTSHKLINFITEFHETKNKFVNKKLFKKVKKLWQPKFEVQ